MGQIDEAVAKTEAKAAEPKAEEHSELTVTIASTGRHVVISFPVDMTDAELLEFIGWESTSLRLALAAARAQRAVPQIAIARSLPA